MSAFKHSVVSFRPFVGSKPIYVLVQSTCIIRISDTCASGYDFCLLGSQSLRGSVALRHLESKGSRERVGR